MNPIELKQKIEQGRQEFEQVLARIRLEGMDEPALSNGWSVKDLLGHLAFWEGWVVEFCNQVMAGKQPEMAHTVEILNRWNARIFEQNHARPVLEVLAAEQAAFRAALNAVESIPEDMLFDPARFAITQGITLAEHLENNTSGHFAEHLPDLHAWLERKK